MKKIDPGFFGTLYQNMACKTYVHKSRIPDFPQIYFKTGYFLFVKHWVFSGIRRLRAPWHIWNMYVMLLWALRYYASCGVPTSVEGLYCKMPILCLASSELLTPHPLSALQVRGEATLAGWRGVGGSIVRKTPDTALYSIYVSTLYLRLEIF